MPFDPNIMDDLAKLGANITIDALPHNPAKFNKIMHLWAGSTGTVTIRNAGQLPSGALLEIAHKLGGRVTLEE